MIAIAAVSANWGIGKDNDLLFHIPEDLAFFRKMTDGATLVIGRKNLESFPGGKPLPGRRHLLLTRQPDYEAEGCDIFQSYDELLPVLGTLDPDRVWLCGGGMIYRDLLAYCETAYITQIDSSPDCDVYFPDLDQDPTWILDTAGEWKEFRGLRFRFTQWKNLNVRSIAIS